MKNNPDQHNAFEPSNTHPTGGTQKSPSASFDALLNPMPFILHRGLLSNLAWEFLNLSDGGNLVVGNPPDPDYVGFLLSEGDERLQAVFQILLQENVRWLKRRPLFIIDEADFDHPTWRVAKPSAEYLRRELDPAGIVWMCDWYEFHTWHKHRPQGTESFAWVIITVTRNAALRKLYAMYGDPGFPADGLPGYAE